MMWGLDTKRKGVDIMILKSDKRRKGVDTMMWWLDTQKRSEYNDIRVGSKKKRSGYNDDGWIHKKGVNIMILESDKRRNGVDTMLWGLDTKRKRVYIRAA